MNLVGLLTLLSQILLFIVAMSLIFRTSPITLGLRVFDQTWRNLSGRPIQRLSRITPQLYIGGQHYKRGWKTLQSMGITAVVNLRESQYDDKVSGIAPERYLHLPTIDGTAPSVEQLEAGLAFIKEAIANGGRVYIHCASGIHRAPTMAMAYLISTGLSLDEALLIIQKVRPFARPIAAQKKQLELFARQFGQN